MLIQSALLFLLFYILCLATTKTLEHRRGNESSSVFFGPQQNLQTQTGRISQSNFKGKWRHALNNGMVNFKLCSYLMLGFFFAANVHFLCAKLQVHFSQCASHDQLHAENFGRDVLVRYTGLLSACLYLHSTAGHSPQKCHDHEEKGLFVHCSCFHRNTQLLNYSHKPWHFHQNHLEL